MPCVRIGSARMSLDRHARVERGHRVLEDDVDVAAHRAPVVARRARRRRGRARRSGPACGAASSSTSSSVVVLPQPDSPTSAERLAVAQVEADPVDRADGADLALEDRALEQRVVADEVLGPRGRPRAPRAGPARPRPRAGRAAGRRRSAPSRPPRSSRRGGTRTGGSGCRPRSARGSTSRQVSNASGQRAANGQPAGRSTSEGGVPSIGTSGRSPDSSARGIAPSSPIVYGIRGL